MLNRTVAIQYREIKKRGKLNEPVCQVLHHRSFAALFVKAAQELNLKPLPVCHRLRHAGASFDRAQNLRSLEEV